MAAIVDLVLGRFFSDAFRAQHPEVVETVRAGLLTPRVRRLQRLRRGDPRHGPAGSPARSSPPRPW
jgi:hypothetical protein